LFLNAQAALDQHFVNSWVVRVTSESCRKIAGIHRQHAMLEVSHPMEQKNLDTLKSEIDSHLKDNGFVVFRGHSRSIVEKPEVEWDTARYPDFREFLAIASQLGVKLIVFHDREFSASIIDRALEEIEESSFEFEDQRELERKLRELRVYEGFTCALELSFEYTGQTYFFELRTGWYSDLNELLDELDMMPDEDDDDGENPLSGYYSKN
jgi:hypothetical protein